MSYAITLINQNNLKPADAIVLRKKFMGMVDHFAIFLGYDKRNQPIFVANYTKGVKQISESELNGFLEKLNPTHIERFEGNDKMRLLAVKRAVSRIGERAYDYFSNNCESFKNYVQKGVSYSKQAENFNKSAGNIGIAGAAIGIGALATKNKKVAGWALGISALAAIAYIVSKDD